MSPLVQAASDNYLRLYFMPSMPTKIDWSSPRNLLTSTLDASAFNPDRPIGHATIEIFCGADKFGRERWITTGSVSQSKTKSGLLLADERVGFSLMAISWAGRLESEKEIFDSLDYRGDRPGYLSALTFSISASTCRRVAQYYDETVADPYPRTYGFAARPRRHEGAGCSAYVASYLEVAGLMTADLRSPWIRNVNIPISLMPGYGPTAKMTVREVLKHPDSTSWATIAPKMSISLYDPDLMHQWLVETISSPGALARYGAEPDSSLSSKYTEITAISIDARSVSTPTDDLFTGPSGLIEKVPTVFFRNDIVFEADGSFQFPPE